MRGDQVLEVVIAFLAGVLVDRHGGSSLARRRLPRWMRKSSPRDRLLRGPDREGDPARGVAYAGPPRWPIPRRPFLLYPNRNLYTHAWFPRDRFDEVVERAGWFFARRGDGFLALRSQRPARWSDASGEDEGRELVAEGRDNV